MTDAEGFGGHHTKGPRRQAMMKGVFSIICDNVSESSYLFLGVDLNLIYSSRYYLILFNSYT